MSSRYEDVLERIDAFLTELDLLVRQAALQSIQLALTGEPAPESVTTPRPAPESGSPETPTKAATVTARRRSAAPFVSKQPSVARSTSSPGGRRAKEARGRKAAAGGAKRSAKQLGAVMASALKHIRRHPGSRMEQIAAGLGLPSKELVLPLRHLKSEGRLKTKGQKRATSYFAK
ncbi:MAG: hypothetical protein JW940_05905 [Polyangiaceae bacterium]|nr:hypothetical protein [Polyangiaceae bacterium]